MSGLALSRAFLRLAASAPNAYYLKHAALQTGRASSQMHRCPQLIRTLASKPSPPSTPAPPVNDTTAVEANTFHTTIPSNQQSIYNMSPPPPPSHQSYQSQSPVLHSSQDVSSENNCTESSSQSLDIPNADTTNPMDMETAGSLLPDGPVTIFSKFLHKITRSSGDPNAGMDGIPNTGEIAATTGESTSSFSDILLSPALSLLNYVHDITGLPWWLSIPLATMTIRVLLLPVTVMTMKNSAVMAALKDDIAQRREGVMEAARSGNRLLASQRQNEMQSFMQKAGIAPMRVLVGPMVQFPVFISFFVSIRRLASEDPTMANEGLAWFSDLSISDPYYVLPVLCGATLLAMTEFGGDTGSTTMTPQMRLVMRVIAGASIPLTYWFPSAVFCYWIPNNLFSVSLGAAMRMPAIKKSFGLLIDPANIPGSRAAQLKLVREMAGAGVNRHNLNFDPAAAAASYGRNRSPTSSSHPVKPVLLKSRRKKVKAIS